MPFNTRNPIPSGDLRDLDDNARNIDTWANDKTKLSHPDRFGVERRTWHGIEQEAQLNIQQAIDAKNAAQEAAMMSGFSKYADTLAQLEAGIGTDYVDGDVVMVFQDESRGDTSSIFKIESGAAEFKLTFDKTRQDLLSFTGNISADTQWSDVPAHSDPAFDVQAQALANRAEFIVKELTRPSGDDALGGFDSYEKLREYAGDASSLIVTLDKRSRKFFRDDLDTVSNDDGGLVIIDALGRRWKSENLGYVDWAWWGITGGTYTAEEFSKPFHAAMASGIDKLILPLNDVTVTGRVIFTNTISKALEFICPALIKFAFTLSARGGLNALEINGNGNPVKGSLQVDCEGCGRYPDEYRVVAGVVIFDAPFSDIYVHTQYCHGFGQRYIGCDNSNISAKAFECDGQKVSTDSGGAFDNYGDGVYISSENVTLHNPHVVTTRGGRGGIVFERYNFSPTNYRTYSGTVINPYISGYDRNIHVEGAALDKDSVTIIGGLLLSYNSGLWNFSQSNVTLIGTTFESTSCPSVDLLTSSSATIASYGGNTKTTIVGCKLLQNFRTYALRGNGSWNIDKITLESGAGAVEIPNSRYVSIRDIVGEGTLGVMNFNACEKLIIDGFKWPNNITLPSTNNFSIRSGEMIQKPDGFCGRIVATNKQGGMLEDVVFQNPLAQCVDNYRSSGTIGPLPVFQNIRARKLTAESNPRIFEYAPTATNHDYRSALPSYVYDTLAGTVTEIPPRTTST